METAIQALLGLSIHYRENYCQITVRKKKGSRNTNDEKMDRK